MACPGQSYTVVKGDTLVAIAQRFLSNGARLEFDLDREEDRAKLASHVNAGAVASVQTREFDFHAAFLKLTGTEFD